MNGKKLQMNRLWAPWRMEYIQMNKDTGCVFCMKSKSIDDESNLILYRGNESFILFNLYPYTNGHLMISPYKHTSDTNEISDDCNKEIMFFANQSMNILKICLNAEGFNFGANLGKCGGAGIEDHLHYHIVPRWSGDTNFMPVLGGTKVVVEGLKDTWNKLKPHFEKINGN